MKYRLPLLSIARSSRPFVFAGALSMLALSSLSYVTGLRLNLTGSIPIGLYRVIGDASNLKRGDVVLACLPPFPADLAHSRGYVPRGSACAGALAPVGKIV